VFAAVHEGLRSAPEGDVHSAWQCRRWPSVDADRQDPEEKLVSAAGPSCNKVAGWDINAGLPRQQVQKLLYQRAQTRQSRTKVLTHRPFLTLLHRQVIEYPTSSWPQEQSKSSLATITRLVFCRVTDVSVLVSMWWELSAHEFQALLLYGAPVLTGRTCRMKLGKCFYR
jgi:hypothetical protein